MRISTEYYIRQPVLHTHNGPNIPNSERRSKTNDLKLYKWSPSFHEEIGLFRNFLAGRRYQKFEAECDVISKTIEDKYIRPVYVVAHLDLLDPQRFSLDIKLDSEPEEMRHPAEVHLRDLKWRKSYLEVPCVCVFVPPGAIDWGDLKSDKYPMSTSTDKYTGDLIQGLVKRCVDNLCTFGVITDESLVAVLDLRSGARVRGRPDLLHMEVFPCEDLPVREVLAYSIYQEADPKLRLRSKHDAFDFYNGALDTPTPEENQELDPEDYITMEEFQDRQSFGDFDIYTMQRDVDAWDVFRWWRSNVMAKVARCPFSAGDILPVEKDGFLRRLAPLRSLLPQNTVLKRAEFPQRPRHEDVDAFLAQDVECKFEITQTIRTGRKHYSQVVLGRFVGCQRLLCLKIFDERYFPPFWEPDYAEMDEQGRLLGLVTADDMVRREESAYYRLQHFQGSMIPHCYGFHQFTMPDGWRAFGLVMEVIEGASLYDTGVEDLAIEEQIEFIRRLRAAVEALCLSGIDQRDWHLDQVLCPYSPGAEDRAPNVVLIDFGFASLRLGDRSFDPVLINNWRLWIALVCGEGSPFHFKADFLREHWPGPARGEQ